MNTKATIQNGVVINLQPSAEAVESDIDVPDYVRINDTTPDNGVTFYRNGTLVQPTLVPVSKYKIKTRVTAQEWAALKAAIANDADAQENWDITQEIDPAHPQTQQVISYLQEQGQLTTPLWQIFA